MCSSSSNQVSGSSLSLLLALMFAHQLKPLHRRLPPPCLSSALLSSRPSPFPSSWHGSLMQVTPLAIPMSPPVRTPKSPSISLGDSMGQAPLIDKVLLDNSRVHSRPCGRGGSSGGYSVQSHFHLVSYITICTRGLESGLATHEGQVEF